MDAAELGRWTRFAAKGGIGRGTAIEDCVAQRPEDLMFLKNDEITVLMQLPEEGWLLGYCEGVVGRFQISHVRLHGKLKRPVITKRSSVNAGSSSSSATQNNNTIPGSRRNSSRNSNSRPPTAASVGSSPSASPALPLLASPVPAPSFSPPSGSRAQSPATSPIPPYTHPSVAVTYPSLQALSHKRAISSANSSPLAQNGRDLRAGEAKKNDDLCHVNDVIAAASHLRTNGHENTMEGNTTRISEEADESSTRATQFLISSETNINNQFDGGTDKKPSEGQANESPGEIPIPSTHDSTKSTPLLSRQPVSRAATPPLSAIFISETPASPLNASPLEPAPQRPSQPPPLGSLHSSYFSTPSAQPAPLPSSASAPPLAPTSRLSIASTASSGSSYDGGASAIGRTLLDGMLGGSGQGGWSDDDDDDDERSLYGYGDDEAEGEGDGRKDGRDGRETEKAEEEDVTQQYGGGGHQEAEVDGGPVEPDTPMGPVSSVSGSGSMPSAFPATAREHGSTAVKQDASVQPTRSASLSVSSSDPPPLRKSTSTTTLAARTVPPAPLHLAPRHAPIQAQAHPGHGALRHQPLGAQYDLLGARFKHSRTGLLSEGQEALYADFPLPPVAPLSPRRRVPAPVTAPQDAITPTASSAGVTPTLTSMFSAASSKSTPPTADVGGTLGVSGKIDGEAEGGIGGNSPGILNSTISTSSASASASASGSPSLTSFSTSSPRSPTFSSPKSAAFPSPRSPNFSEVSSPRSATFSLHTNSVPQPQSPRSPRSPVYPPGLVASSSSSAPAGPSSASGSPTFMSRERAGTGERIGPGRRWPVPRSSSHPPPTGPLPSPTLPPGISPSSLQMASSVVAPPSPTLPLSPSLSSRSRASRSVQSRRDTAGSMTMGASGRPETAASVHTIGSVYTTGSGQGLSGGEEVWDGAGDIYDDYMYRYSMRSMYSVHSGPGASSGAGLRQSQQSGYSQFTSQLGQRASTFSFANMGPGAPRSGVRPLNAETGTEGGVGSRELVGRISEDLPAAMDGPEAESKDGVEAAPPRRTSVNSVDPALPAPHDIPSRQTSLVRSRRSHGDVASSEDTDESDRLTDDYDEGSEYGTSGLDALQARFNDLSDNQDGDREFDDMSLRGRSGLSMLADQVRRAQAASESASSTLNGQASGAAPQLPAEAKGGDDAADAPVAGAVNTSTEENPEKLRVGTLLRPPFRLPQLPSPLLHTTWTEALSSPEDGQRSAGPLSARSDYMSPQVPEFPSPVKDDLVSAPTQGGAASALRQRIEAQAVAHTRKGRDPGEDVGDSKNDVPAPPEPEDPKLGLGGRIVVDDDDPAPDVSLTTARMGVGSSPDTSMGTENHSNVVEAETSITSTYSQESDMSVATVLGPGTALVDEPHEADEADDADGVSLSLDALSSAAVSAGLAPLPLGSSPADLTASTSSIAPSSDVVTPRPRPLQRTLAPPPPGGAERASLFMPHPGAPKAPSAVDRSSRVLHMQAMLAEPGSTGSISAPDIRVLDASRPADIHPAGANSGQNIRNHLGRGQGGLVRTLRAATTSRGVLGRGPTVYARCEEDLAGALGPVRVEFSLTPFVGAPPGARVAPQSSSPPSSGPTPQQIALAQELRRSPAPPHSLSPGAQAAPSLAPSPTPRHSPIPAIRHASPVPRHAPSPSPSQVSSHVNNLEPTETQTDSVEPDARSRPPTSTSQTVPSAGDVQPASGASGVIPRANFFPRAGTSRPRSRSFSEFRSSKTEISVPMSTEKNSPLGLGITSPRRGSGLSTPPPSPQVKASVSGIRSSGLRGSYAPSPLSIPPMGASGRPPKSPTSPLAQTVFSPSSPTTAVPSTAVPARPPHQLRQVTSNPSLNDSDGGKGVISTQEPVSPGTTRSSMTRRIPSDDRPSSPSSPNRPTGPTMPPSSSVDGVRVALSPQPGYAPSTSPGQSQVQVARQSSLRSKLSLPNLRRKQSRQDETASIAASSVDGGASDYELAQVQGLDFELVRPNLSQLHSPTRTSEESSFVRDPSVDVRGDLGVQTSSGSISRGPSTSSPSSALLRPISPAMSMSSFAASSQRSPSVTQQFRSSPRFGGADGIGSGSESASMDAHRQRELKWMALLSTGMTASQARKSKKVKKLLLEGVPASVRYLVWSHLTDGKTRNVKGVYERLVGRGRVQVAAVIERDAREYLERRFHSQDNEPVKQDLHLQQGSILSLLQAYLTMVPDVQYTKGLALIAGSVLLLAPEEDAFWIFVSMMDSHLRPYFALTSPQMEVDATLFTRALEANDPSVAKKLLVNMSINPTDLCSPWFSTLFVDALPPEYLDRVWDLFLYEGIPFLSRVGLALVTLTRRQLLDCANPDAALHFLHYPPVHVLPPTAEAFISLVYSVKLKDDDFRKQRVKMEAQLKRQTHVPRATAPGAISLPKI